MICSRFDVHAESREYPVYIGQNLIVEINEILKGSFDRAFVISDDIITPFYLDSLVEKLNTSGIEVIPKILQAGESSKTLDSVNDLYAFLSENLATRSDAIIALGGGVIGDIAGFVASTFKRGMMLIQVPTTLLAQVDSSIGGKTGVNLSEGKNLVGTFYQPHAVIVDVCTLNSLPTIDFLAGLAEVVKYGVTMDPELFQILVENRNEIILRNPAVLTIVVERALRNKAQIIKLDEREEKGKREILNFGHTIGHAIETCSNHTILHGQAVAIGMVEEAKLAVRKGLLEDSVLESLISILELYGLPTEIPDNLDIKQLSGVMKQDKKVRSGQLKIPVLVGLGKTEIMIVDLIDNLSSKMNVGENIQC
ncbi:MAG: 3-dehydroquinate synthase [Candidatus Thorarchaeota archaeon]